jgi:hypothetical protein
MAKTLSVLLTTVALALTCSNVAADLATDGVINVAGHTLASKRPLFYPGEHLPRGNRTVFAMEYTNLGGLQIVSLGKDGQLWHTFQIPDDDSLQEEGVKDDKIAPKEVQQDNKAKVMKWTPWVRLTDLCPSKQNPKRKCVFDADPVVGRNKDGRLEVFVRFQENLDTWQLYQTDPKDPTSWTIPRESSCVDQDQDTGIWYCLHDGTPVEQSHQHYWIVSNPVFPTSDFAILNDPVDGRLRLWYRNFDGHMYMVEQKVPGQSDAYTAPQLISGVLME